MVRVVIWDWNATLLADAEACTDAANYVIRTFGGKPLPRNVYNRVFDFPTLEFYCNQGADRDAMITEDHAKVFHEYYEPRASRCRTRKNAKKALNWLKERSIDSVILSNHIRDAIIQQLQRLVMERYFVEVLANENIESTTLGKNKIYRIRDYLSRNGYNPSQALIVGDSPEDIRIGKELGMGTIGITDGYISTPRLRASEPDYLISNLIHVIEIIEDL